MITIEEFLTLVHDEVGLPLTTADAELSFDRLPDWDSVHLLSLLNTLERTMGRPVSLPDILEADTLRGVYEVVVGG